MNVKRWAQALREEYPQGLLGEREALVNLLVGKGLSHAEAAGVARALEAQATPISSLGRGPAGSSAPAPLT